MKGDPHVASVSRWGRWLQILLAVGFVLDVVHALVAWSGLQQILPTLSTDHPVPWVPMLHGSSVVNHVPGEGRVPAARASAQRIPSIPR